MLNWNQVSSSDTVYLAESIEMNSGVVPSYTKCTVISNDSKLLLVMVDEGQFKNIEIYFYKNENSPKLVMTQGEYVLWEDLNKIFRDKFTDFEIAYVMLRLSAYRK